MRTNFTSSLFLLLLTISISCTVTQKEEAEQELDLIFISEYEMKTDKYTVKISDVKPASKKGSGKSEGALLLSYQNKTFYEIMRDIYPRNSKFNMDKLPRNGKFHLDAEVGAVEEGRPLDSVLQAHLAKTLDYRVDTGTATLQGKALVLTSPEKLNSHQATTDGVEMRRSITPEKGACSNCTLSEVALLLNEKEPNTFIVLGKEAQQGGNYDISLEYEGLSALNAQLQEYGLHLKDTTLSIQEYTFRLKE